MESANETLIDIFKHDLGMLQSTDYDDSLLQRYLNKAKKSIMKYCRLTEEEFISKNLQDEQLELAKYYYENKKMARVKKHSESKRSITFEDANDSIPKIIKDSLPLPKMVMW